MRLVIKEEFPLGRFTEPRGGEACSKSPNGLHLPGLLRALAMRWVQYSLETGDRNEAAINSLIQALALSLPQFALPVGARGGPAIRQYQPTGEFAWSDPSKGSGAVKTFQKNVEPRSVLCCGAGTAFLGLELY